MESLCQIQLRYKCHVQPGYVLEATWSSLINNVPSRFIYIISMYEKDILQTVIALGTYATYAAYLPSSSTF